MSAGIYHFVLKIFITQNSSDRLNWMSDSPVSIASNRKVGILLFERSFTFPYISDIILRDSDQVSAKRGWSPSSRQGKANILVFEFKSDYNVMSSILKYLSVKIIFTQFVYDRHQCPKGIRSLYRYNFRI